METQKKCMYNYCIISAVQKLFQRNSNNKLSPSGIGGNRTRFRRGLQRATDPASRRLARLSRRPFFTCVSVAARPAWAASRLETGPVNYSLIAVALHHY